MRSILRPLLALFCLTACLHGQDSLVFDQRYKGGHRYHQTVTNEQQMDMDAGAQRVEQRMAMSLGMLAVVADLPGESGKRVAISYDHASINQTVNGVKYSYDSKSPDAANAGPLAVFGAIVGKEFQVLFDSEDNVRDVLNFEETMQKMAGGNANTATLYSQLFNKNTVKRMMQQASLRSPAGKPVRVGEAWEFSSKLEMPGIGALVVQGFYTFKGMKDHNGIKVAIVDAKADIQVEVSKDEQNNKTANLISQMNMKIEEGRMEGTLLYDPAINFTREADIRQTITLTAVIPDGSRKVVRLPMKQNIRMVLDEFAPVAK